MAGAAANGGGPTGFEKDNHGGDGGIGGSTSVEGLILTGQAAAVEVAGKIEIKATGGNGGGGSSSYGEAGLAGVGGAAKAYGLVAVGNGVYQVKFADLELTATGGNGGYGAMANVHNGSNNSNGDNYQGSDAGEAGSAFGTGVAVQGGLLQLEAANISSIATGGNGSTGGMGIVSCGRSSDGGLGQALGIEVARGTLTGTVTGKITATAKGGAGAQYYQSGQNGGPGISGSSGGVGIAKALAVGSGRVENLSITGMLAAEATGGDAGKGMNGSDGGDGGEANAYGLFNTGSTAMSAGSISAKANGGAGGAGGAAGNGAVNGIDGTIGIGGEANAYGLFNTGSTVMTTDSISAQAQGGTGVQGLKGSEGTQGENGAEATAGGSGSDGSSGSSGSSGGLATAYGLHSSGGITRLSTGSISAQATGGQGGQGGMGGKGGKGGNGGGGSYGGDNNGAAGGNGGKGGTGGNGGQGGSALGYGVYGSNSIIELTVDSISVQAIGGTVGTGGTGGSGGNGGDGGSKVLTGSPGKPGENGVSGGDGNLGQQGAQAEAYGVYAANGAVITLSAKTAGRAITIGAKAENALATKAYTVYADNATVLFNDNAVLSSSDGTDTDAYDVLTGLNNATLGFGSPAEGQEVGRTITGGTLQLEGSNTFKVATDFSDLANIKSDSFTFAKLAADSSAATQYITVGYDKAFDGSKLDSFIGEVTVLTVTDLNGQNLNNFVGKESELDDPLARFLATPTVAVDGSTVKITQIDFAEAGASETVMTAADAQMSIGNLWRVEGNNLMKRMGDLRSDPEAAKGGVWARYYRGEMSADSSYDRSFDQDYTAFQGGIDKVQDYKGGKLYTGIAVNRIDSNAGYNSGSGDMSSTGVGLYASWLGSKGHYLDVIARGSKLANDFKLVDKSGNTAKGDYDTWAYGISAEYGYRQNLQDGWFVEPQAELSLGRIGSADYTMSNGTQISQDAVNSAVTRIGVLSGKEFTMNGRQGNAYVKASLLHDFGGNGGGAAYYNGRSTVVESADMSGTWWELGLGANLGLAKNSNLYFDALKTFGGDLRTEWQFNAGLRFTF